MSGQKIETEIHAYLDSLSKDKFYGEITLYFQDGNIEFFRKLTRLSKKDIINRQIKSSKKIVVARGEK